MVWDAFKAFLRGALLARVVATRKRSIARTEILAAEVERRERIFVADPVEINREAWLRAQDDFKNYSVSTAEKKRFFTAQKYYEEGEGTGQLLANIVQSQLPTPYISAMKDSSGVMVTETGDIQRIFVSFYSDLYTSKIVADSSQIDEFLDRISLPTLPLEAREILDAPLTLEEVQRVVGEAPGDKAPGTDGLPSEIYKKYLSVLGPELLHLFTYAYEVGHLPESLREAMIITILKPGKDPYMPDSYRPISLLQTDVKLLAKILALRLTKYMTILIHPDQSGFIPSRSTATNLRRLFLNMQLASDNMGNRAILSLDAAKAFDSVEWEFLWKTLRKMGFGPVFIRWIQLLYDSPVARIKINKNVSDRFLITCGTRQGCPLSPLLFALVIEPLAEAIRSHPGIVGFRRSTGEDKIALYADDALLFLGDTGESLRFLFDTVTGFGELSGLRINWHKSVLMALDPIHAPLPDNAAQVNIVEQFKYLGIVVSGRLRDYVPLNVEPLLQLQKSKCKMWSKLPLSVVGRVNLIKMIWMPQWLYVLHNSPIWLPQKWFRRIDTLFRDLIWRKGKARISLATLQLPEGRGGLAVPHMTAYYLAAQLQQMMGWGEKNLLDPIQRIVLSRCPDYPLVSSLDAGIFGCIKGAPTLGQMDKVWRAVYKLEEVKHFTCFTPLWHNPALSELLNIPNTGLWSARGLRYLYQLYSASLLKSFEDLCAEFDLPRSSFFLYLQVRHALGVQAREGPLLIDYSMILARMARTDFSKKGAISDFYGKLMEKMSRERIMRGEDGWRGELGVLDKEDWTAALAVIPVVSLSQSHRLTQLFIIHRTYHTPVRRFQWGRVDSPLCTRCEAHTGTLLHMFWKCPKLFRYWHAVFQCINEVYQVTLPFTPEVGILGILREDVVVGASGKAITRLLYIARKLIAQKWLAVDPPTLKSWEAMSIRLICHEYLMYQHRNCVWKFHDLWDPWLQRSTCRPPAYVLRYLFL